MHRVMEATLPVERSRMPSGRLMPPQKALLARHAPSTSPDMIAPLRCPSPCLQAERQEAKPPDLNRPRGHPQTASSDFNRCSL